LESDIFSLSGTIPSFAIIGMGAVAGAELVAAVSNAGGIGVLGGVSFTAPARGLLEHLSNTMSPS
jgi:NAD(P)H-dependent flavin oxidoreductase YrpB (nitropropane dioxygenase family)